jgi:hypothetical protein
MLRAGGCEEKTQPTEEDTESVIRKRIAKVSAQGMRKTGAVERKRRAKRSYSQVIHNTPSVRVCNVMRASPDVKKKLRREETFFESSQKKMSKDHKDKKNLTIFKFASIFMGL